LEWLVDSDCRVFPTIRDETFGYVPHPVDLATNKVAAAYGGREPRDVVDLVTIRERILPLGAVVWASVGKTLGFTPEGVINEIRRTARYTEADFRRVASDPPVDPAATMKRLRETLCEVEGFVARMPTGKVGLLLLKDSPGGAARPRALGGLPNPRRPEARSLADKCGNLGCQRPAVSPCSPNCCVSQRVLYGNVLKPHVPADAATPSVVRCVIEFVVARPGGVFRRRSLVNWNKWFRQIHRWLSIAFTVAVIVNVIALITKEQAVWVGVLALIPLALPLRASVCHEAAQRAGRRR
jgi:hypothetical protein